MTRARIVYQDWIVQLGHDPDVRQDEEQVGGDSFFTDIADLQADEQITTARSEQIEQAVAQALHALTEDEREFIARFHFMGESYQEISEKSGRIIHKLEALHKRALRKLQHALSGFVASAFNNTNGVVANHSCIICQSAHRSEINQLIINKPVSETWRPIIRQLREQYGIAIRSPQVLIGHQKYHGC